MRPLRSQLRRRAVWLLFGALLVAEGWWLDRTRESARSALVALAERRREGDRLARLSPAPTGETERAIESELTDVRRDLTVQRAAWANRGGRGEREMGNSVEAFFGITAFVENARARAEHGRVKFRPDECFGFASFLHQGPAAELAPVIARQCEALQYLVGTLVEARPQVLLAVRRERPLAEARRNQGRQNGSSSPRGTGGTSVNDHPEDYFEWADRFSLRAPGQIESDAFQLEFSGQTSVLRAFLNRLAADGQPIVVRSVEAGPVDEHDTSGPSAVAGGPVPLVAQNLTHFTVVVEFVELVAETKGLAP